MLTSIEIWFSIFDYLEVHDLFHAFTNLNTYFQQLITSQHLSYNIQFKKNKYSSLISIIYCSSNTVLNQIISLQWIAKTQYGYLPHFINKNILNLARLESLQIEIVPRQTLLISKILPDLNSLQNLSITCETISFLLPSLRLCELISSNIMSNIECVLNRQNNIEILYLTNISICIRSNKNSFFDYLSNLKSMDL